MQACGGWLSCLCSLPVGLRGWPSPPETVLGGCPRGKDLQAHVKTSSHLNQWALFPPGLGKLLQLRSLVPTLSHARSCSAFRCFLLLRLGGGGGHRRRPADCRWSTQRPRRLSGAHAGRPGVFALHAVLFGQPGSAGVRAGGAVVRSSDGPLRAAPGGVRGAAAAGPQLRPEYPGPLAAGPAPELGGC